MSKVINAIYENGVFKPLEKVDIEDCSDTDLSSHHDKYLYHPYTQLVEFLG